MNFVLTQTKGLGTVPPNGFDYKQRETGEKITAMSIPALKKKIREHRAKYHLPIGVNFDREIDAYISKNLSERFQGSPEIIRQYSKIDHKTLDEQASAFNGAIYRCPKNGFLDAAYHYNTGMIRRDDGLWLVYRKQIASGRSTICVVKIDENTYQQIKSTNKEISMPQLYSNEHYEDPRATMLNGNLCINYVSWRGDWKYTPSLVTVVMDRDWNVQELWWIDYGGNMGKHIQKNWCFFEHDKRIFFFYWAKPYEIVEIKPDRMENRCGLKTTIFNHTRICSIQSGMDWEYGIIRGGTPPIRIGDEYFAWMHSSNRKFGRNTYFAGCFTFEATFPFRPKMMTKHPLLHGTDKEPNLHWAPLVAFPCGNIFENDNIIMSMGVNDSWTAIVKSKYSDLKAKMVPV